MGEGLKSLAGLRQKTLDAAEENAVKPRGLPDPSPEPPEPVHKPTTAAEAQARMDALRKKQAEQDTASKGLPKPGLLDRIKKATGL